MRIKTKLTLGLGFLFLLILLFSILSIFYINRLKNEANVVLRNNHESLVYCNNMLKASEGFSKDLAAFVVFEENLSRQEQNITESGEMQATQSVRKSYDRYLQTRDPEEIAAIRRSIYEIELLNQQAIVRKNAVATATAENANLWLSIIFTILTLIAFSFVINFPAVISKPVTALAEGIREIAQKNYRKRIHLGQKDEFGDLAETFNQMAEKLDEYENSNLARLKFEKKRIETIINQMTDGIIGLDERKHILFLNAVAEKMLGLKEAAITGLYAADIALQNDLMRTLLQENGRKELKIYADGKESYFSKDILHVMNGEEEVGQVIVLKNITPFHELNEAKTNFIATVSHELKTPISSIRMSASLLNDSRVGSLNAEQHELLQSISDDTDRLLKITSELLNMAQVETGNIQLKLHPAAPARIVELAMQAVHGSALQKGIVVETNAPSSLPKVNCDEEKTTWVLINLLTNALRFAPESTRVRIDAKTEGDRLIFSVTDQGKGIDEKYLPRVFERYYKVPGETKSGTGLGLAISKEFIEAQGGRIYAVSRVGEGSTFSIELPIAA